MGLPFRARKSTTLPSCAGALMSGTCAPTASSVDVSRADAGVAPTKRTGVDGFVDASSDDEAACGDEAACVDDAAGASCLQPASSSQLRAKIRNTVEFELCTGPN